MLKRSPSLTEQVKTYLKQRINNAEFEAGRMPSEADLANELNVSRNTIRDALSRLEAEGVVVRRQGAGPSAAGIGAECRSLAASFRHRGGLEPGRRQAPAGGDR